MTSSSRTPTITPDEATLIFPPKQIATRCATLQDLIDAALRLKPGEVVIGDAVITPEDAAKLLSRPMSPAEAEEQRRSFAFGNTTIENPRITRAMIDKAAKDIPDA